MVRIMVDGPKWLGYTHNHTHAHVLAHTPRPSTGTNPPILTRITIATLQNSST